MVSSLLGEALPRRTLSGSKGCKVRPDQFWQKATDTYNLYHDKYRRAVLTDEEKREGIGDFLTDMEFLAIDWHSSQGNSSKEDKQE